MSWQWTIRYCAIRGDTEWQRDKPLAPEGSIGPALISLATDVCCPRTPPNLPREESQRHLPLISGTAHSFIDLH